MTGMVDKCIDFKGVDSEPDFHCLAKKLFGFPDFYGNNFSAFIDCLTSLRYPEDGMTSFHLNKDEKLFLHLKNIEQIDPVLKGKLIKSLCIINQRSLFMGDEELIIVDVV